MTREEQQAAGDGPVSANGRHEGSVVLPPAPQPPGMGTLAQIRTNPNVEAYIAKANEQMAVIGYTEHGSRHAAIVAAIARSLCLEMGRSAREAEIAAIA